MGCGGGGLRVLDSKKCWNVRLAEGIKIRRRVENNENQKRVLRRPRGRRRRKKKKKKNEVEMVEMVEMVEVVELVEVMMTQPPASLGAREGGGQDDGRQRVEWRVLG